MKSSAFSQAGLLLIGGTVVLLIGALVKFDPETAPPKTALATTPVSAEPADDAVNSANDWPLPPRFPAALAQVVKLTRAGLGEDVVLAYVQNSGAPYAPTADEMIYLHRAGVPESVMAALVKHNSKRPAPSATAPPSRDAGDLAAGLPPQPKSRESQASAEPHAELATLPPPAPTPVAYNVDLPPPSAPPLVARPPADSDAAYFFDPLAPYGDWSQTGDGEWVWQPTVEQAVPEWTPYRDGGQWQFTDSGWAWASAYPWGWAAFHYGRWANDAATGWTWHPGHRWGPAWVTWRQSRNYFGWAPLPPGVSLNMEYYLPNGGGGNFNLTASAYTFVPASSFLNRNLSKRAVPPGRAATLLADSVWVAPSRLPGIPVEEVAAAVGRPITPMPLREPEGAERGNNAEAYLHANPAFHSTAQPSASTKQSK